MNIDKYVFTHINVEEGKEVRRIDYNYTASDFEQYEKVVAEFSNFLSSVYWYKINLDASTDLGKPLDIEELLVMDNQKKSEK
jgi:hypothetical protein